MLKTDSGDKSIPSISRSTIINISGAILPGVVLLLSTPLYLRFVGTERFGVLSIIWLLLGYFGAFDFGLGRAVTNRIAKMQNDSPEERSSLFWTALSLSTFFGVLGGGLIYFLRDEILSHFFHLEGALLVEAKLAFPWIVLSLPLVTFISVLIGALEGRQTFLELNIGQSTGLIFSQIFPLAAIFFGKGSLSWLVSSALIGRAFGGLILLSYCRRFVPLSGLPVFQVEHIRPLLRYGTPITISNLVGPILTVFDRFVIGALKGMTVVTDYSIPYRLVNYLSIFPRSLTMSLFPRYTILSPRKAHLLMRQGVTIITVIMTPLILIGLSCMHVFLAIWVGQDLAEKSTLTGQILLCGIWINSIAYAPSSYLQGRGRPDITARFHLLELFPYIVVLWMMVEKMGMEGAAWAWTVRVTIDAALLLWAGKIGGSNGKALFFPSCMVFFSLFLFWSLSDKSPWRITGEILLPAISLLWAYKTGLPEFKNWITSVTNSQKKIRTQGDSLEKPGPCLASPPSNRESATIKRDKHADEND